MFKRLFWLVVGKERVVIVKIGFFECYRIYFNVIRKVRFLCFLGWLEMRKVIRVRRMVREES